MQLLKFPQFEHQINEPLLLHEGDFEIYLGNEKREVNGIIEYQWMPNPRIKFFGRINERIFDILQDIQLSINNKIVGSGFLTSSNENTSYIPTFTTQRTVSGRLENMAIGESDIKADTVHFFIPNFLDFRGDSLSTTSEEGLNAYWLGRWELPSNTGKLVLYNQKDSKSRHDLLRDQGGHIVTCVGEIKLIDQGLSLADTLREIESLSLFLSFINGRSTVIPLITGYKDGRVCWKSIESKLVPSYKYVHSWMIPECTENVGVIFQKFSELISNKEDQSFIYSVIRWYNEANLLYNIESSIVISQIALELIYNWLLIEKKKLLSGSDANGISAENKIKLLLAELNVCANIPEESCELLKFAKSRSLLEAPATLVLIRNALTHGQMKKRTILEDIPPKALFQALQISLFYIELSILKILGFEGEIKERFKNPIGKFTIKFPIENNRIL